MKKRLLLLIGLVYPVFLFSQINGRVIDADTRGPLENVRITLPGGNILHTNHSGTFYLNREHIGEILRVNRIGYLERKVYIIDNENLVIELQPNPEQLEEVTISDATFADRARNQTGSMNLLLSQDNRYRDQEHLSGWINQLPGIYMHTGSYNTNRLTIRGIGSREPYGSSRIKAYLNDIPISGADGVTVIEDISLSGINRIELLKGPSSAIYGAGLGGALRLFTPYPSENGFSLNTLHQAGSFGLHKHALNANFKKGSGVFALDIGHQRSGGYRENSQYFNNHLLFRGDLFLNRLQFGMLFMYINMKAHIPSSLDDSTFRHDPSAAAANWANIRGYEAYGKYLAGISISNRIGRDLSQKTTVFAGNRALNESRPFNILQDHTSNAGFRSRWLFEKEGFRSIAGLEFFAENINWSTYETQQGVKGVLLDDIRENRYYTNLFNLYKWSLSDRFLLEAGWNMGWIRFSLVESNNAQYPAEVHRFTPVFSPRIGANYRPVRHFSLFGSAGKGFSTPSFEETLLPEGIRNDKLQPEKGWNFELGARGDLGTERIAYDISVYMIFVNDLLVTKRVSEEIFTGVNAGSSRHMGLETLIRVNILKNETGLNKLILSQSFQYSKNRFGEFVSDSVDYSGNHLPGIPVYKGQTQLTWTGPRNIGSSVSILLVGSQYLRDDNELIYSGYQTVDWNLSWSGSITRHLGISVSSGINNLFDRDHASMILINAPSFGSTPPRYYYPGMPRNVYLQLRVRVN